MTALASCQSCAYLQTEDFRGEASSRATKVGETSEQAGVAARKVEVHTPGRVRSQMGFEAMEDQWSPIHDSNGYATLSDAAPVMLCEDSGGQQKCAISAPVAADRTASSATASNGLERGPSDGTSTPKASSGSISSVLSRPYRDMRTGSSTPLLCYAIFYSI